MGHANGVSQRSIRHLDRSAPARRALCEPGMCAAPNGTPWEGDTPKSLAHEPVPVRPGSACACRPGQDTQPGAQAPPGHAAWGSGWRWHLGHLRLGLVAMALLVPAQLWELSWPRAGPSRAEIAAVGCAPVHEWVLVLCMLCVHRLEQEPSCICSAWESS